MQLTDDTQLLDEPYCIDGSASPAPSDADTLALLPSWARTAPNELRDAVVHMQRRVAEFVWQRTGNVLAAVRSPINAEGVELDGWGAVLKRRRQPGEQDAPYRTRLVAPYARVTPAALRSVVDSLVSEQTTTPAAFIEPAQDAMFISRASDHRAGTVRWCSYVQPRNGRLWSRDPDSINPTRGAYIVPAKGGATFWFFLPVSPDAALGTAYIARKTDTVGVSFIMPVAGPPVTWAKSSHRFMIGTPNLLFNRVADEVAARRGAGIRWAVYSDPNLSKAK